MSTQSTFSLLLHPHPSPNKQQWPSDQLGRITEGCQLTQAHFHPTLGVVTKLRWCSTDERCGYAVATEHLMFTGLNTSQSHHIVNTNHMPKRCNVCSGLPRRAFQCPPWQHLKLPSSAHYLSLSLYICQCCPCSSVLPCICGQQLCQNPLEEKNGDLRKSRLENALKKQQLFQNIGQYLIVSLRIPVGRCPFHVSHKALGKPAAKTAVQGAVHLSDNNQWNQQRLRIVFF